MLSKAHQMQSHSCKTYMMNIRVTIFSLYLQLVAPALDASRS